MLRSSSNIRLGARYEGYAYQVEAVEAVKGLHYSAIFHEQGLGKTKIGVDLALDWLRTDEVELGSGYHKARPDCELGR